MNHTSEGNQLAQIDEADHGPVREPGRKEESLVSTAS